ncbi:hypothetical protein [Ensifer adhaerens]|uniref:hypothetical protein n=1 Tax=Ensifer adhaerens TaxID=106592 RepID=UPI001F2FCE83|nr:hypothetical protein [Ensifer adhaerens]
MFQAGKASTEELTNLIYGSVFGECSWQDFLNRLATTMPNGKSSLHYQDVISPNAHVPYSSGFTGDDIDRYHAHFFAVNPWMAKAMLVPLGVGVQGEDMVARDRLVRSEFYNDVLKGQTGCETSVGMTIIREKGRSFILSTYTSSTDADLNGRAASQLTALAPHLKRAFDFVRKRDVMTADQHSGQSLFDAIGVGLIYAGENGRIRSMNESAQRLAAAGAVVRITPNGRVGLDLPANKRGARSYELARQHPGATTHLHCQNRRRNGLPRHAGAAEIRQLYRVLERSDGGGPHRTSNVVASGDAARTSEGNTRPDTRRDPDCIQPCGRAVVKGNRPGERSRL